jgi:broad specificity phosphatase PhoE
MFPMPNAQYLTPNTQSLISMNTLYLVRHAHTQQTALPVETWPLSESGIQQARKLAELPFWQDVQTLVSGTASAIVVYQRPS